MKRPTIYCLQNLREYHLCLRTHTCPAGSHPPAPSHPPPSPVHTAPWGKAWGSLCRASWWDPPAESGVGSRSHM